MFWRRQKFHASAMIQTLGHPAQSLVTVLVSMLGLLDVCSVSFRIMNWCIVFGTTPVADMTLVTDVTSSLTSCAVAFHIISVF
jgi:hypothetical protein